MQQILCDASFAYRAEVNASNMIFGASLCEPQFNVENGMVVHVQRIAAKTGLQHTITVWYSGSCTNKHDKFMDTSIQVLSDTRIWGSFTDVPF